MKNIFLGFFCLIFASFEVSHAGNAQINSSEKIENLTGHKKIEMNNEDTTPQYLYKIVSPKEYRKSLLQNEVVSSLIDKEFFHLSTENQISHVVQKFWKDQDYVILKLDSKKLIGRLVYEINPGGTTQYYHLYEGKIPLDAIVDVLMKPNNDQISK